MVVNEQEFEAALDQLIKTERDTFQMLNAQLEQTLEAKRILYLSYLRDNLLIGEVDELLDAHFRQKFEGYELIPNIYHIGESKLLPYQYLSPAHDPMQAYTYNKNLAFLEMKKTALLKVIEYVSASPKNEKGENEKQNNNNVDADNPTPQIPPLEKIISFRWIESEESLSLLYKFLNEQGMIDAKNVENFKLAFSGTKTPDPRIKWLPKHGKDAHKKSLLYLLRGLASKFIHKSDVKYVTQIEIKLNNCFVDYNNSPLYAISVSWSMGFDNITDWLNEQIKNKNQSKEMKAVSEILEQLNSA